MVKFIDLDISQLHKIIRVYKLETQIIPKKKKIMQLSKAELVAEIEKHLELKDDKIFFRQKMNSFDIPKASKPRPVNPDAPIRPKKPSKTEIIENLMKRIEDLEKTIEDLSKGKSIDTTIEPETYNEYMKNKLNKDRQIEEMSKKSSIEYSSPVISPKIKPVYDFETVRKDLYKEFKEKKDMINIELIKDKPFMKSLKKVYENGDIGQIFEYFISAYMKETDKEKRKNLHNKASFIQSFLSQLKQYGPKSENVFSQKYDRTEKRGRKKKEKKPEIKKEDISILRDKPMRIGLVPETKEEEEILYNYLHPKPYTESQDLRDFIKENKQKYQRYNISQLLKKIEILEKLKEENKNKEEIVKYIDELLNEIQVKINNYNETAKQNIKYLETITEEQFKNTKWQESFGNGLCRMMQEISFVMINYNTKLNLSKIQPFVIKYFIDKCGKEITKKQYDYLSNLVKGKIELKEEAPVENYDKLSSELQKLILLISCPLY